jgi:alcohol dehydrogenase, propanol-preferring
MSLAPKIPVRTTVEGRPLTDANDALDRLRAGRVRGAEVLVPGGPAAGEQH